MAKEKNDLIKGLKQAMQAELDGHNFYKMAASKTKDSRGREMMLSLAKDEMDHFEFLRAQFESITKGGKVDKRIKLTRPKGLSSKNPIFSSDFKSRIKKAHFEMSALSIAAQLELSSINFYKSEARKAIEPEIKAFFIKLADWEAVHYRMLVNQQSQLQEEYWFANRFFPT